MRIVDYVSAFILPAVILSVQTKNQSQEQLLPGGIPGGGMIIHNSDPLTNFLPPISGYTPESNPYSNPLTASNTDPVKLLPSSPDCTIRPQTVMKIQAMRKTAAEIAQAIQIESGLMSKRKAYVEQMTAYLNDRIRELNKVKTELKQEVDWIDDMSKKINEISEQEKLFKMEDVMTCLDKNQQRFNEEAQMNTKLKEKLESQKKAIEDQINEINKNKEAAKGKHI